jgi:hypothetical protein
MSVARDARAPAAATERAYVEVAADVDNWIPDTARSAALTFSPSSRLLTGIFRRFKISASLQRTSC